MKKAITIFFLLAACVATTHATSYAQTKIRRSTVLTHRTSFSYGRYSTGIGRHTMDMSDRRAELTRQSDGRQEMRTYGYYPYWWYNHYSTPTFPPSGAPQTKQSRRSVYSMVDQPSRVTGYQPLNITFQSHHTDNSSFAVQSTNRSLVSSEVTIGELIHTNSWGGFGGSSSGIRYGRTSNGETSVGIDLSSFAGATPKKMAVTTADSDPSDPADIQQFAENPTYDSAPMGDSLLPLLLLLTLVLAFKARRFL